MKLIDLWKKLGKQPFKPLNKEAVVFVGDEKYIVTGIRYENGKPLGFETEKLELKTEWFDISKKPKVHEWVVVRDKDGKEYDKHQWIGHAWYRFVLGDDGICDGWRTNVDIVQWRYLYKGEQIC